MHRDILIGEFTAHGGNYDLHRARERDNETEIEREIMRERESKKRNYPLTSAPWAGLFFLRTGEGSAECGPPFFRCSPEGIFGTLHTGTPSAKGAYERVRTNWFLTTFRGGTLTAEIYEQLARSQASLICIDWYWLLCYEVVAAEKEFRKEIVVRLGGARELSTSFSIFLLNQISFSFLTQNRDKYQIGSPGSPSYPYLPHRDNRKLNLSVCLTMDLRRWHTESMTQKAVWFGAQNEKQNVLKEPAGLVSNPCPEGHQFDCFVATILWEFWFVVGGWLIVFCCSTINLNATSFHLTRCFVPFHKKSNWKLHHLQDCCNEAIEYGKEWKIEENRIITFFHSGTSVQFAKS